jgi:nucleoid-associated protein YgaU
VKKGDTLYSIARSQYQDESAWKQIYDANRDRLGNPGDVRAGMKLTIPPAGAAGASGSGAAPASAPSRGASTTYTVRKGENLHTIADKMYGSQSYWTLIRDANRDKLSDVDEVRAGTKLVLPPKPSSR